MMRKRQREGEGAQADDSELELRARSLAKYEPGRAAPPLEEYVAEAREAARIVGVGIAKRKLPSASTSNGNVASPMAAEDTEARVAKAEAYARWRWQGYADGEIASL